MLGMNALTGAPLEGDAHLAQSIGHILETPIGSVPMLRDYGSLLFELIDQPGNMVNKIRLYAATALALLRWEPRLRLTQVKIERGTEPGQVIVSIDGHRTDRPVNSFTRLTLPLRLNAPLTA